MRGESRERIPYLVAGGLLLLGWALLWLVGKPIWRALWYLGWAILAAGFVLIALPLFVLPRKGKAPEGKGVTETTRVVSSGIYALIRHPLYLGWMLVYAALTLLAQHWLVVVVACGGIVSVYLVSVREDDRMLARFGRDYARYMRTVPRVNLLAGVVRLLQRRMRD